MPWAKSTFCPLGRSLSWYGPRGPARVRLISSCRRRSPLITVCNGSTQMDKALRSYRGLWWSECQRRNWRRHLQYFACVINVPFAAVRTSSCHRSTVICTGRIKCHNTDNDTGLREDEQVAQCLCILRQHPEEFPREIFFCQYLRVCLQRISDITKLFSRPMQIHYNEVRLQWLDY